MHESETKESVCVYLPRQHLAQAKELGLNLSQFFSEALISHLDKLDDSQYTFNKVKPFFAYLLNGRQKAFECLICNAKTNDFDKMALHIQAHIDAGKTELRAHARPEAVKTNWNPRADKIIVAAAPPEEA